MKNILATLLALLICHLLLTHQLIRTQVQNSMLSQEKPNIELNSGINPTMNYQSSTDSLSFWNELPEKLTTIDEKIKTKTSKFFIGIVRSILSRRIY